MTEAEEKRMANLENLTVALLEFCQTLQARVEATDVIAEAFIQGALTTTPAIKTPFSDALAELSDEREPTIPEKQRGIYIQKVDAMAENMWNF